MEKKAAIICFILTQQFPNRTLLSLDSDSYHDEAFLVIYEEPNGHFQSSCQSYSTQSIAAPIVLSRKLYKTIDVSKIPKCARLSEPPKDAPIDREDGIEHHKYFLLVLRPFDHDSGVVHHKSEIELKLDPLDFLKIPFKRAPPVVE